jgi:hypothetical protein
MSTNFAECSDIHTYVINIGKGMLMQGHNISETSRLLGFEFPHPLHSSFQENRWHHPQ